MSRIANRVVLLVVVPVIALGVVAYFYAAGGRYVSTQNAYIKAKLVSISTDIDGRVIEVRAENNQRVKARELLFRVDPQPAKIALAGAQAELVNVRQQIESLRTHYQQGQMEINAAKERIRFLTRVYNRQTRIKNQGLGTETQFDEAEHNLEMARRSLEVARQRSSIVLAQLGGNPRIPTEEHALFIAATAKRDQAARQLQYTSIYAPKDGILSNVNLEVGEYVETGKPIFALVAIDDIWVEANLKESQLTHVRENQRATVVVDAYPDRALSATVESLSPTTGAVFAVLPPQNATGNWVKVVQRIPVRLRFDDTLGYPPLRAGMTVTVSIDTEHKRELLSLLRK